MKELDPETARKKAWLNRYRESVAEQKRLADQLEEERDRATSISAPLCAARSAPTGSHSDRVADSVQRIAAAEQRLQAEQERGQDIAFEIINAAFDQLPLLQAQALVRQYVNFQTAAETARELGYKKNTIAQARSKALAALVVPEDAQKNTGMC